MTLNKLIDIVNKAYSERVNGNYVEESFKSDQHEGDTLALFIAREIRETYDPNGTDEEQLAEALRVMEAARDDIGAVVYRLSKALCKVQFGNNKKEKVK